jgi:Sec7-like guanine-nucleotide exchange factor
MNSTAENKNRLKGLPQNTQSFQQIISCERIYVDKTPYIYSMVKDPLLNYMFLSRPRRFGKTLLLDTLKELFLGRRHLFENLWISRETDYDFQPHPVIRLSMNYAVTDSPEKLKNYIIKDLLKLAEAMDVDVAIGEYDSVLKDLIKELSNKHGVGVVILIDEYDAPVAGHIEKPALAQANS